MLLLSFAFRVHCEKNSITIISFLIKCVGIFFSSSSFELIFQGLQYFGDFNVGILAYGIHGKHYCAYFKLWSFIIFIPQFLESLEFPVCGMFCCNASYLSWCSSYLPMLSVIDSIPLIIGLGVGKVSCGLWTSKICLFFYP